MVFFFKVRRFKRKLYSLSIKYYFETFICKLKIIAFRPLLLKENKTLKYS